LAQNTVLRGGGGGQNIFREGSCPLLSVPMGTGGGESPVLGKFENLLQSNAF